MLTQVCGVETLWLYVVVCIVCDSFVSSTICVANDIANGRGIINYTTPLETLKLQQTEFCLDMCNGYYGTLPNIDSFTYRYVVNH